MTSFTSRSAAQSLLALVTSAAFVLAPMAGYAQQSGAAETGQTSGDPADQTDATDENSSHKKARQTPAGPTPKLFVLPTKGVGDDISDIIPDRVGEMLRAQIQGKSRVDLLATYDKLQQRGGGRANAAVTEAKRQYTSGIGLLTAGQNEKAAKSFQKAVDTIEQNLGDLQNFDVLADAYKNMALAYFKADFDFDARKRMKVYADLRPQATLDEEKFPKELRDIFTKETSKIERGGPGKLVITADVGEALVYIDGESRGKTPATVDDIGYGYHYMVVRAPGGAVWSKQIRVRGRGKKQDFSVELGAQDKSDDDSSERPAFYSGLMSAIQSGSFGHDLDPYLSELITRTGANYVAWVAMVKRDSAYVAVPFVYRATDKVMVQADGVEFNIELSNLRVGVSNLGTEIVDSVDTMPPAQVVDSVELTKPADSPPAEPQPVASAEKPAAQGSTSNKPAEGESGASTSASASATKPSPDEPSAGTTKPPPADTVEPPPAPSDDDDGTSPWIWAGAGGAVAVAGVIAGVLLLSGGGGGDAGQFDATLTW